MTWQLVTAFNLIIAVCYLGISFLVFRGLATTEQLRTNRLGVATGLIFFTCAVHHGSHSVHMLLPTFGVDDPQALALREAWHWPTIAWDILGATVAVYYFSLRSHYGGLLGSPGIYIDFKERERQALEINDNIVQGLSRVKWQIEAGRQDEAREAADATLREAQRMITDLLHEAADSGAIQPGALRRRTPTQPAL